MSTATTQPAALNSRGAGYGKNRGLSHLLHALNQPLTGLQCSLELAASRQSSAQEYLGTIREALTLTDRLRILVEALRAALEFEAGEPGQLAATCLNELLHEVIGQLRPVAETRGLLIQESCKAPTYVALDRGVAETQLFRLLESALNLAKTGGTFNIVTTTEELGKVCVSFAWDCPAVSESSGVSRAALGLLIAQAMWEQSGAEWEQDRSANLQRCTIRMPLLTSRQLPQPIGDER